MWQVSPPAYAVEARLLPTLTRRRNDHRSILILDWLCSGHTGLLRPAWASRNCIRRREEMIGLRIQLFRESGETIYESMHNLANMPIPFDPLPQTIIDKESGVILHGLEIKPKIALILGRGTSSK